MSHNISSKLKITTNAPPKIIYKGILKILNLELPCAVLENGLRIITARAVYDAFGKKQQSSKRTASKIPNLPHFVGSENLKHYINKDLQDCQHIEYIDEKFRKAKGYKAEIIPTICTIFLKAKDDGVLLQNQLATAVISKIILYNLAKVGINALIDEATGYQGFRPKDDLQRLLEKYITKDFSIWSKKFPDSFYKEIFRLKGWELNKSNFTKRPGLVGTITNQLVYSRLAPEILTELKKINPKNDLGHRDNKHHQFLTSSYGQNTLAHHIYEIMGVMKTFKKWSTFFKFFNKTYPIKTIENIKQEILKIST